MAFGLLIGADGKCQVGADGTVGFGDIGKHCCCKICCEDNPTDSFACEFSSDSYLSLTVTSTPAYTPGFAPMATFLAWLVAYFLSNPTFSITWNPLSEVSPSIPCNAGADAFFASYWLAQIGTVNGYPVYAFYQNGQGRWQLAFYNGNYDTSGPANATMNGALSLQIFDESENTCESANGIGGTIASGRFFPEIGSMTDFGFTGSFTVDLTVENNSCDEGP